MRRICFVVGLLALLVAPAFADNFNPADYTLTLSAYSNGSVTTNAPSGFTLAGSNTWTGYSGDTAYWTTFAAPGITSFDWSAWSNDSFYWDRVTIAITFAGTQLFLGSGTSDSGSLSIPHQAGETLSFDIYSLDNLWGASYLQITNYNDASVPEPASLVLLGTGLLGLAARIRRCLK